MYTKVTLGYRLHFGFTGILLYFRTLNPRGRYPYIDESQMLHITQRGMVVIHREVVPIPTVASLECNETRSLKATCSALNPNTLVTPDTNQSLKLCTAIPRRTQCSTRCCPGGKAFPSRCAWSLGSHCHIRCM